MKKIKKVEVEKEVYYSDISGKKIEDYDEYSNQCARCGKHFIDDELGEMEDDGSLCKECSDAGYKFKYGTDGSVGVVDKKGKYVDANWF